MERRTTRNVLVKNIGIGSQYPISIQTMLKCKTIDLDECRKQIHDLEKVGCDLLRVSVPNKESVSAFGILLNESKIPLIADIHYNYDLAIQVLEVGAPKIRMNPGNMYDFSKIEALVSELKNTHACIRIGVNSGSIHKNYASLSKENQLLESTKDCLAPFERLGFNDIVLGLKSSDIDTFVSSNIKISKLYDYPMHIGLTEAGPLKEGLIKSTIGISRLLEMGIGDTIRVSLSSNPIDEVIAAKTILKSLNLKKDVVNIISCPTCARTMINVQEISEKIEKELIGVNADIKIAIMGCPLNGIEEGKDADIGLAAGDKESIIFTSGQIVKKIDNKNIVGEFIDFVYNYINKEYGI